MDINQFKDSLRGVAVTTVTPFSSDLSSIDTDGIRTNIEHLVAEDARLVIPCGNTGEFYSLTENEWQKVVTTTKDAVGERLVIIAGIGHSLKTAQNQINHAEELGLDGVMVMYPQHVFSSEEGILNYYRDLLGVAKEMGVVLYKKGPLLSDNILEKLFKYENLVAVKYAFGRIVDFSRTVHNLGKPVIWSCGTAERFAPFYWLAGAEALTTGLGNFAPRISQSMYDALTSGDYEGAMKIQKIITPLEELREGRGKANNVPVVKAVMDHLGLAGGDCRPPIHTLSVDEKNTAVESISNWDLKS
ncbi:MAG: dihydrodipicolinate synthase family protein [Candidatus Thorarchaeota archaeon]|nr:dihydrodipicolinate synthase family protein [Candidatus Thorarchaeota archaeon]